jgi:hypothetical protein
VNVVLHEDADVSPFIRIDWSLIEDIIFSLQLHCVAEVAAGLFLNVEFRYELY